MRPVLAGTAFEECPRCDAHFFDRGELGLFLHDGGMAFHESAVRAAMEEPTRCRWCETQNADGARQCGACGHDLAVFCPRDRQRMMVARADGFDIDVCPTCTAIWLDGDELRRLTETLRDRPHRALADLELLPLAEELERTCEICNAVKPAAHTTWFDGLWQCAGCRHDRDAANTERLRDLRREHGERWQDSERSSRALQSLEPVMRALSVKYGRFGDRTGD